LLRQETLVIDQPGILTGFIDRHGKVACQRPEGATVVANTAERGLAAGGLKGMRESMLSGKEMFESGLGPAYDVAAT
jgi:hypothetical protein